MRARLGAWAVDSMLLGGFQIGFWMVALALGAISINPAAQQEIAASPMTLPSVAPYQANLPLLGVLLAIFVGLNIAYATLFWARYRGLPGQLLLSIQVGLAANGETLGWRRAFARALVAIGVPVGGMGVLVYAAMAVETTVPWSEIANASSSAPASSSLTLWALVLDVATLVTVGFPILMLILTAASANRQGPHDRLAGSLVVGQVRPSRAYQGYGAGTTGFGPRYGTPPGYWPGYGPPAGAPPNVSGEPVTPSDAPTPETQAPPPPGVPGSWSDGGDQPPGAGQPPLDPGKLWIRADDDVDRPRSPHAATVGRRIAAYIFDCAVVYMVFTLLAQILVVAFLPAGTTKLDEKSLILIGLVGGFWQMAYFTTGWAIWRGTLSQKLLHLEVTDATTGKPISWLDAVVRWAVLQGPFALVTIVPAAAESVMLVVAMTWVIYLLYSTQNNADTRGLHDRFMNTRVSIDL